MFEKCTRGKGRKGRIFFGLCLFVVVAFIALGGYAQEPTGIPAKQAFLVTWEDQNVWNATMIEVAKTKKSDSWGTWNILWEGWSLDVGGAYDSNEFDGAVALGRRFGTIGDYLPIDFPFKDYLSITLYPIGARVKFDEGIEIQPASGGAYFEIRIEK